jgi:diguanylate cyclase (GGDEF)-like protein
MFRERLTALLATPDQAASAAAVLILDLDRFKAINDSLGASVGDALLGVVAERIRSAIGHADVAARFGGDEFGIVQIGRPQPQSAAALAKRLVDLLGRSYIVEGHLLNVGASVGIALTPADGRNTDQILKNADLALNRAKQRGQDSYRFFETAMDEQMQAHRGLELDFRRALALREFAIVYQPQLNLGSKRITGFEALLRWHNPKRGLVSPADFIPLAEEIGLIVPIGEWVIRTACSEAAGWPQPLSVAVNVSAVQFGSPNLVSTVLSALAESGLDPRRLELEITESVLVGDHRAALDVLLKVRELGVRVSMDDFGTGYSSLSYLRSFPFDKIKIDQSFVRGQSDDPSGMAIVRAIAGLGRSLGMTTLAEGVETEEQLARVAADGCTDVQGYLISRPLPPERIGEFLQSHTECAALGDR